MSLPLRISWLPGQIQQSRIECSIANTQSNDPTWAQGKKLILPTFYNHLLLPFFNFIATWVLALLCIFSTHDESTNFVSSALPPLSIKNCHCNQNSKKSAFHVLQQFSFANFSISLLSMLLYKYWHLEWIQQPSLILGEQCNKFLGRILQKIFSWWTIFWWDLVTYLGVAVVVSSGSLWSWNPTINQIVIFWYDFLF